MKARLKKSLNSFLYKEETGKMLNYFTLQINEPEVAKDLVNHRNFHQNSNFWITQPMAIINLCALAYSTFFETEQKTIGTGDFIGGVLGIIVICGVWPILYMKYRHLTRFLFSIWFCLNVALHIAKKLTHPGSIFHVQSGIEHEWISLTIDYIIIMTTASYCEYNQCLFLHSPLYIIATYVITNHQNTQVQEFIKEINLNKEHQYSYLLPKNQIYINMGKALLISTVLLAKKFLERLDVCFLIIKKWTIQKQQSQLTAYFQEKQDGVIIYHIPAIKLISDTANIDFTPSGNLQIQYFNESFQKLVGFDLPNSTIDDTSFTFSIADQTMDHPIFKFEDSLTHLLKNSNLEPYNSENSDDGIKPEGRLFSLFELLRQTEELYENRNLVLRLTTINTKTNRIVQLQHQKLNFNNKECFILSIKDISVQRNLEKEKNKNTLLNLLTSSVSHELLTPIRCIIFMARQLIETLSFERDKLKACLILDTSQLLHSQVQMLLDRSLMENNRFTPQLQNSRLPPVIMDAIEIFRSQASLKNLNLYFKSYVDDLWLMVDEMRVKQIVMNLISNAIKFSFEDGVIQTEVFAEKVENQKVQVKIMVTDNGIGLSEEDQRNLFKPYFKTTDKASKQLNKNSYGLGLNICQKIANGLAGTIFVDSIQNQGTTFTFQFVADEGIKQEQITLESRNQQILIQSDLFDRIESIERVEAYDRARVQSQMQKIMPSQGSDDDRILLELQRELMPRRKFKGHIIVAEDQIVNLEVLKSFIFKLGLLENTIFCIDGQKAIDAAKNALDDALLRSGNEGKVKPVALMLLDFQMPLKNGIQVVQETKQYFRLRQDKIQNCEVSEPIIVFLTAFKTTVFTNYLKSLNINHCFEKPIQLEQLHHLIEASFDLT